MQTRTEAYYERFLERVASGRDMTRDAVHEVAQGRIWSGQKALELGLVDRIGTLDDAIRSAAKLAGLDTYHVREYPILQNPLQKIFADLMEQRSIDMDAMVSVPMPEFVRFLEQVRSGEPMARLPYGIMPAQ